MECEVLIDHSRLPIELHEGDLELTSKSEMGETDFSVAHATILRPPGPQPGAGDEDLE